MVEEAVFRVFAELAESGTGHVVAGPRLAELGWSEIEAEYPVAACELLFRAQGRSLAQTDCLDRVMLAELVARLDAPVDAVVLPELSAGDAPTSGDGVVCGIVAGPAHGRLVVPVPGALGTMSLAVVDADRLVSARLDTFDPSVHWTRVKGELNGDLFEATAEWNRAVGAAHRAVATELIALADEALRIAVRHCSVRVQFGSPIGSFQAPRHLLADAAASLEGARALVAGSWGYGGQFSGQEAKATAGRAHRKVCSAAQQVCGAIGVSMEHDLHRYVARGFQIDALLGSYQFLEAVITERLFDTYKPGQPLPTSWRSGDLGM
ncbi:acyl-CoA dehydrogenase [Mycobacterium colombiense]|uniref:acyl-CoA dehydrogenase family protein n=1 Tax=Mycobacterium colombiense TaxID=339268 RepID=UPI0007EF0FAF|nr:acyl-CoA dehydrogenase family protein [Mycobacterium colombiense]OBK68581.1 acyl-CoA dehydrogenase [Mycobacterium colombiense]